MSTELQQYKEEVNRLTNSIWRQGEELVEVRLKWIKAEQEVEALKAEIVKLKKRLA